MNHPITIQRDTFFVLLTGFATIVFCLGYLMGWIKRSERIEVRRAGRGE